MSNFLEINDTFVDWLCSESRLMFFSGWCYYPPSLITFYIPVYKCLINKNNRLLLSFGAIQIIRDTFWPILDPPCVIWCHCPIPPPMFGVTINFSRKSCFNKQKYQNEAIFLIKCQVSGDTSRLIHRASRVWAKYSLATTSYYGEDNIKLEWMWSNRTRLSH